jgi:hypothetical protein
VESICGISDRLIMLSREKHGIVAAGRAAELMGPRGDPVVSDFLTRRAARPT